MPLKAATPANCTCPECHVIECTAFHSAGAAELCEKSDPQMKEKQTNSTLALKTPCPSPAQINPMGRL